MSKNWASAYTHDLDGLKQYRNDLAKRNVGGRNDEQLKELNANISAYETLTKPVDLALSKIDFKTLDTKDVKPKKEPAGKSDPIDKVPDQLKLEIDLYTDLNATVDELTNAKERLKNASDSLTGDAKIEAIRKEIKANEDLVKAKNNVLWQQRQERNDLNYTMSQNGFNMTGGFDTTNRSTNLLLPCFLLFISC